MKIQAIVLGLFVILFASVATALLSINPYPVYLGDSLRGVNFTGNTFNITNTASTAISSVSISSDAASKYRLTFNTTSISSLGAGSTATIAYNLSIPTDEPIGNRSLASLNVSAGTVSNSTSFMANVKGRLNIKDVDVTIDGKGSSNMQDGGKITQDAKPRSRVKFEVDIENLFDKSQHDIDIEDVQVTITIEEIDDGDDIELESGTFDINAGRTKIFELSFEVPEITAEGAYDVKILAEGITDEDAEEQQEITILLEVEKQSHDIHITQSKLDPATIVCSGQAKLDITIQNVGDQDERLAYILVESPGLKYRGHAGEIELFADPDDEENIASRNFTIAVPRGTEPGSYSIETRVYDDNNDVRDYNKQILTVESCTQPVTPSRNQTAETGGTRDLTGANASTAVIPIIREEQPEPGFSLDAFRKSPLYWPMLGLIALVVFFAVVIIILKISRK
ncbi:hypothetical protein HYV81_01390 [Candidatus Woesearchaeota archaeon]|nr:hypothetical protein [Candidatus Woesearchaeota archaeon]